MSDKGNTKLRKIALPDGTLIGTTDITDIIKNGDGRVRNIAIDKADNLAVWEEEGFYIKPVSYQAKTFEKAVFGPVNQIDAEQNADIC